MAKEVTNRVSGKVRIYFIPLFIICCLLFASCSKPLHKKTFVISGTYLEVISPNRQAPGIVYDEFRRLNKIFNFYDSQSEISRLNRTYDTPHKASKELMEVIKLSQDVFELTDGVFDVSCGRLYEFWKKLTNKGKVEKFPSEKELESLKMTCGMKNLKIDKANDTVSIAKDGLEVDLSAIAKGYMVDRAILKLREAGIDSAIINAGGDIYCLGTNHGLPWRIGIRDPKELEGIIEEEDLTDEAVATSGGYEQFFEFDGRRFSHLIDPRTGKPVDNNVLSVSVISKNCTTSDAFATAFFIMGLDGIKKFLAQNPSTMRIFVVTAEGKEKRIHLFK